jgi:hypothetical protein
MDCLRPENTVLGNISPMVQNTPIILASALHLTIDGFTSLCISCHVLIR